MTDQKQPWTPPDPHDLLIKVRDAVKHRIGYSQKTWYTGNDVTVCVIREWLENDNDPGRNACGSRMCVAGLTVAFGDDPRITFLSDSGFTVLPADLADQENAISWRAQKLLNLSDWQANWLFASYRSPQEVLWGLSQLIADPAYPIQDGMGTDEHDDECGCDDCNPEPAESDYTVQVTDIDGNVMWSQLITSPDYESYPDLIKRMAEDL